MLLVVAPIAANLSEPNASLNASLPEGRSLCKGVYVHAHASDYLGI